MREAQMTSSPVFSLNFTNRKHLAKSNYHISIKKILAMLNCFIDPKKTKPCFATIRIFFISTAGQGVENTK